MLCASFPAIPPRLEDIRTFVEEAAHQLHVPEITVGDIVQAVDEAATNIILHGYDGREGLIVVEVERQDDSLVLRLHDWAPQYDPTTVQSPNFNLGLEQRRPGGLGIYLIRLLMDRIEYRYTPEGGNELTLVKQLS
jgi:anti-sigma regulatory factor (Ser/Thr protein kinase)